MASFPFPQFLLRLALVVLLAVNGLGSLLMTGSLHHVDAAEQIAMTDAMPQSATDAGCHDDGPAPMPQTTDPAACCEDGRCDLSGCECACIALTATLPVLPQMTLISVPPIHPDWVPLQAHAAPPSGALIRPPIA